MDRLNQSPTFDGADLGLDTDATTPVSWRFAVTIWIVFSTVGWAAVIGLVLAFL